MHYQTDFDHLFRPPTRNGSNPLRDYICDPEEDGLFDLPRQIPNNPFAHSRATVENRPFYSRNQQSTSKCAVTEMSSKGEEECEESITPVCQKLFDHHTCSRIEKEFQLPQTLPSEQMLSEATFKPTDLADYLKGAREQQTSKLKQILRDNVFKQQPPKERSRVASSHVVAPDEGRQKTKYEKILEEYFQSRSKKEAIKSRLSQEKLPSIKMQYLGEQQTQPNISRQVMDEPLKSRQKNIPTAMMRSKSEKQIATSSKPTSAVVQRSQLTKTFSQQQLKDRPREALRKEKEIADGWMKMSFQERQSKTLENRKLKENVGQRMNQEKEVKNCTFKPAILDFKAPKQRVPVAGSYAKLYFEKIRRRV